MTEKAPTLMIITSEHASGVSTLDRLAKLQGEQLVVVHEHTDTPEEIQAADAEVTAATGVEIFDRFKSAIDSTEFEASDQLAEALRSMTPTQRRLLQLAIEFAYDEGLEGA